MGAHPGKGVDVLTPYVTQLGALAAEEADLLAMLLRKINGYTLSTGDVTLTAADVGAVPVVAAPSVFTATGSETYHDFTGLNSSHRYFLTSFTTTKAGDDVLIQPNGSSAGCNCDVWYTTSTSVLYVGYSGLLVAGLLSGGSGECKISPRRDGKSLVDPTWWAPDGLRNREYKGVITTDFTSLRVKASAGTFAAGDTFSLYDFGVVP